jgi:hypothetical protein
MLLSFLSLGLRAPKPITISHRACGASIPSPRHFITLYVDTMETLLLLL